MANVMHPHIDFHHGTVAPNLGFGFGMPNSPAKGWQQPTLGPGHNNAAVFQQLASNIAQPSSNRPQKRRHEPDDYENISGNGRHGLSHATATGLRDDAMERSPTPERPKRAPPKRARVIAVAEQGNKEQRKENKPPGSEDDIDVGVLLASLPSQSLLPLLTSLLNAQPSLKATIIPLIPRPTLQTAIEVLAQSAKKLRDAYPYSNAPAPSPSPSPSPISSSATSFGFGSGFGTARPSTSMFGNSALGFGQPSQSMFGHNPSSSTSNNGGMRDSYILSRLRPHIDEFVSTCTSYLPYFSYIPETPSTSHSSNSVPPKQKHHPSDVYVLLSALTSHILSQPPLTQNSLIPLILPRLHKEWIAWVDRVDTFANNEGGMFGGETVKGWERDLDQFADAKVSVEGWGSMREVRDKWVDKVGWLVGRRLISGTDDMEEEL